MELVQCEGMLRDGISEYLTIVPPEGDSTSAFVTNTIRGSVKREPV